MNIHHINVSAVSATWPVDGDGWRTSPGVEWCEKGNRIKVGPDCIIGPGSQIGDRFHAEGVFLAGANFTCGRKFFAGDDFRAGKGFTVESYFTAGTEFRAGDNFTAKYDVTIGNGFGALNNFRAGCNCTIGDYCIVGDNFTAPESFVVGNNFRAGDNATGIAFLGITDGYAKSMSEVNGVAYIGAGCRWFTLENALLHWGTHEENRDMTLCLLESAKAIAKLKGLKFS